MHLSTQCIVQNAKGMESGFEWLEDLVGLGKHCFYALHLAK